MLRKTEKLLAKLTPTTKELDLQNHRLTEVPEAVRHATGLRHLLLCINNITTLPPWIGELTELVDLNLFTCKLTALPRELSRCSKLKYLEVTNNPLGEVPSVLRKMGSIESLGLSGCDLKQLPTWIDELTKLRHLEIDNNELTDLPVSLANLECLMQLEADRNEFPPPLAKLARLNSPKRLLEHLANLRDARSDH